MSTEFAERADGPLRFHEGELLCPTCYSPLERMEVSGLVSCHKCEVCYPVSHGDRPCHDGWGVPVLVPPTMTEEQTATIDAFSDKWDFDVKAVREERERIATAWFMERFWQSWGAMDTASFVGFIQGRRRILDAGCGLGNLTALMAEHTRYSSEVWGLDLSSAIFRARRTGGCPPRLLENLRYVQADLRDPPIAGDFDLIISDGVLHHTDNAKVSLLCLAQRLAPEGDILFYVYRVKTPMREYADDHLRHAMSTMTHEDAIDLSTALADLGRQLREARVTLHLDRDIPALGIKAGDHDLQRFVYWHFLKCFWDDGGNVNASIIENYDWYRPTLASRHTEDEVRGWVDEAGLELVHLTPCEAGFAVHGRRHAKA